MACICFEICGLHARMNPPRPLGQSSMQAERLEFTQAVLFPRVARRLGEEKRWYHCYWLAACGSRGAFPPRLPPSPGQDVDHLPWDRIQEQQAFQGNLTWH